MSFEVLVNKVYAIIGLENSPGFLIHNGCQGANNFFYK